MKAYSFSSLRTLVEETFDVDVDQFESSFQFEPITIEIRSHEFEDKIELSDKGIFYKKDGNLIKGFLYIEKGYNPEHAKKYKKFTIIPKFHVTECFTINEQKGRDNFDGHYIFSNTPVRMVDLDGIEKDLSLCQHCIKKLFQVNPVEAKLLGRRVISTDIYNELILNNPEITGNLIKNRLPKDTFETVLEWGHCRTEFKDLKSYFYERRFTCEICELKLDGSSGYFMEVNFKDGNKFNRTANNLQCLCPDCYTELGHEYSDNKLELFKEVKTKILNINNPYIKLERQTSLSVTNEAVEEYQVLPGLNSVLKEADNEYQRYQKKSKELFQNVPSEDLRECLINAHTKYSLYRNLDDIAESCRQIIIQLEAFFIFYEQEFIEWIEHYRPDLQAKVSGDKITSFYNRLLIAKEYFCLNHIDDKLIKKVYWVRNGASHASLGKDKERFETVLQDVKLSPEQYFTNGEKFMSGMLHYTLKGSE